MEVMNRITTVRKCAELVGVNYGWLLEQLRGIDPPPHYVFPGQRRPKVIPSEIVEWIKQKGAVK